MTSLVSAEPNVITQWLTPPDTANPVKNPQLASSGSLTNIADLLQIGAQWGDLPHIQTGSTAVTFTEVIRAADNFAVTLGNHGVERGNRIFVHGRNSAEWVVAVWGAWRASAVPVLGNPSWTDEEVSHAVKSTSSRVAVADQSLSEKLPADIPVVDMAEINLHGPGIDDEHKATLDARARGVSVQDPAAVVFTSGTTEFAKAALLTHRSFTINLQGFLTLTKKVDRVVRQEPGSAALITAPLFHIGGIHGVVRSLVEGSKRIFLTGRFDAGEVLRILDTEKIRSLFLVPTALARLLSHPDLADYDLSSLRSVTVGAAPVPPSMLEQLRVAIPSVKVGVNTGYGLTETGGAVTAASPTDVTNHPGTVGRAVPWMKVRIDAPDEDGIGEIAVQSGAQMLGYLTENGLIEKPSDSGGWVMTGDLGRLDDDGFLWVEGRTKDVIIRGGENISTARIESVMHTHPEVLEVGAIGLPDPEWGEVVAAVVRVSSDDVDQHDLVAHASKHLARFEIPQHWRLVDEPLPTNDMGKILKRELGPLFATATDTTTGRKDA